MATISVTSDKNIKDLTSAMWVNVATGGAYAGSAPSDPTGTWTTRTIQSGNWTGLCYGLNLVVAVASDSKASLSLEGTTWQSGTGTAISGGAWKSVAFGDGRFIAISGNSRATMYSLDGAFWQTGTDLPVGTNNSWQKICYGNGTWVAIEGGSGTASSKAAYSTNNGSTWTEVALPASRDWRCVTYGNGLFVAVAYGTDKLATSTDGITWTERTASSSSNWVSVCYGNGYYVAVAYNTSKSMRSTDGITWEEVALTTTANWNCITFGECTDTVGKNGKGIFLVSAYGSSALQYSASYSSGSMDSWGADTCSTTGNWIGHCYAPNFDYNTLNILDGAVVNVNDPDAYPTAWRNINITNGKLNITNTSPTKGLKVLFGKSATSSSASGITVSGLGELNITGDWIELGTGDGSASQTFNFWSTDLCTAVWVETSAGSGTYEPWINVTNQPDECPYYNWSKDIMTYVGSAGKYFKQGWRSEPYYPTDRICSEQTSVLTFGDGTNGAVVPNGCKVRVPNIMVSDNSMITYFSTNVAVAYGTNINLTASGVFNVDTCLFDCCGINGAAAKTMHVTDVGMAYFPIISKQNDLVINTMIITDYPVRVLYPSATPTIRTLFYARFNNSNFLFLYLNGATINNLYKVTVYGTRDCGVDSYYPLYLQYCDDISINGLTVTVLGGLISRCALCIDFVNNSSIDNIHTQGGSWTIQNCTNTNVNNLEHLCSSFYKPHPIHAADTSFSTASRYYDKDGNTWVDNDNIYLKWAMQFDQAFLYPTFEDPSVRHVIPFTPDDESFPYYAGVWPANNVVRLDWQPNVLPCLSNPSYEIYRHTSSFTKSLVTFNSSGTAVVTWANHGFSDGQPVTFAPTKIDESVITFTVSNPAVITWNNHGLSTGDPVCFYMDPGGVFPTGITEHTTYYARPDASLDSANQFWIYSSAAYAITGAHTGRQMITYNNSCTLHCVKLSTMPTGVTANTTYYARPDTSLDETNEFWLYSTESQAISGGSTGRQSISAAGSGFFTGTSAVKIYTTNAPATGTYSDTTAVNGTQYYYMLRKYKSYQTFYDSPIWEATPQPLRTISNYCLQSEAFDSSTWVKTGCSVTAAAKNSPIKSASTADSDRITSTNANATVVQTISGLTAGTTYTFGIMLSSDNVGVGVELKLTGGTASATLACDLHAYFQLFTLQITPSGTSVVVQIGGSDLGSDYQFSTGKIIYATGANLDACTTLDHYIVSTAAAVTNLAVWRLGLCFWNWKNRTIDATYTYNSGNSAGQLQLFCHGDTPFFAASYANTFGFLIPSTRNFVNNTNCIYSNFTHNTLEKWLPSSGVSNAYAYYLSNCSNCKLINFNLQNVGYELARLAFLGPGCKNILIANWQIPEFNKYDHLPSNTYGAPIYYNGTDVSNVTVQNVYYGDGYNNAITGILGKNVVYRGVQGGELRNSLLPGHLGTDTVSKSATSVFDTNFFEQYTGTTTGILSIRFNDTENTVNPTITKTAGCGFDCTGKLYIWDTSAEITMTVPYTLYATTGFRNIEPRYSSTFWIGSSVYNDTMRKPLALSIQYSINGGTYKDLTAANLSAETITDGFTFTLKISVRGKVIEYDGINNYFPEEYRPQTGDIVQGWTSGAVGTVLSDGVYNCGTYGQMLLGSVTGIFVDNEYLFKQGPTVTMDIASPGVVHWSNHGLNTGDFVRFLTTGALPTGVTANTSYYVIYIDDNSFWLADSYANAVAGSKINFTGTQNGTHTGYVYLATSNMSTTYADNSMPHAGTYIDAIDIFTTVDQSMQYPIFVADLTFNNLVAGTEVRVYRASDGYELGGIESSGTSWTMEYEWPEEDVVVNIAILSLGHLPQWFSNVSLGQDGYTMLVQQQRDRQYLNP